MAACPKGGFAGHRFCRDSPGLRQNWIALQRAGKTAQIINVAGVLGRKTFSIPNGKSLYRSCRPPYRGDMQDNSESSAAVPKLALTRTEAASALGLSTVTIDRLTKRGLLKPSRATRRPLFAVFEIKRFLKATQIQPQGRGETPTKLPAGK